MTFDRERLQHLESEGLLKSARHPDADLWIYNYTARCQYGRRWTPDLLACRGLILDEDGNVVARPFGKFFNLGEHGAPKRLPVDEPFTITEKIDGSLGIAYRLGGDWHIASRGSFTSDQAVEACRILDEQATAAPHLDADPGVTPLFEIVYPENRIVVDYGGRRELVLLGAIDKETGLDAGINRFWYYGPHVPQIGIADPRHLHGMAKPNAEGFVVSWQFGAKRVKIKFEEYLRLHRVVSGLNEHRVWEAVRAGDDLAALEGLPDETYDFIRATGRRIEREVHDLRTSADRVVSAAPVAPRKEIAAYFYASDANPNLCFALYDGRDITDQSWKLVEPKAA